MDIAATQSDVLTAENAAARASAFLETLPPYPGTFSGRGIVTCAGGARYFTCAWVLIKMLRHLGCSLPVEVWYLGEEEHHPHWIELVEPLGVRCIDACEVSRNCPIPHPRIQSAISSNGANGKDRRNGPTPHSRPGGWESKAFAILHSAFEEVLFLDADNVPVVDPTFLFDTPEYQETGAIFWPDCNHAGPNHKTWGIFGVPYRHEWEQESGQLVIDKRRSWPAMCLCDWCNRHSDFFYQYVYGDKDTFRLAWHRAGCPYAMPPKLDWAVTWIRQADFQGRELFQHRIGDKWSLQGNRRFAEFKHEEACIGFVRELAGLWSPLMRTLRDLHTADREEMVRLAGHDYYYSLVGRRRWPIRLRADGTVAGGGPLERYWWCDSGRMVFSRLDRTLPVVLECSDGGPWQGRTELYGGAEIRLVKLRERADGEFCAPPSNGAARASSSLREPATT